MSTVTIVDYGVGNLASIRNMLKKCDVSSIISGNPDVIVNSSKIILPGVGAFDAAMQRINELGINLIIKQAVESGALVLGICLGAQLLMEKSEEGELPGLSLVKGRCIKFDKESLGSLKIPNMGWNDVAFVRDTHPLARFSDMGVPRFYFTHSYYLHCENPDNVMITSFYGCEFTCGVVNGNIMGVQFHPEKSHAFGARLFTNFAAM
jgi:glutamine amidotransferase